MLHSSFLTTHKLDHPINENSPELKFLRHVCAGGTSVEDYFVDKTASGETVSLYTPADRYDGFDGIRDFANLFVKQLNATSAEVHPAIQTIAGGRAVCEVEIWFDIPGEEEIYKVPLSIFGDLGPDNKLEGARIYYFFKWIPGTPAYNRPIFRPAHNAPTPSFLLTGIMKHYYEQLHNFHAPTALTTILAMTPDVVRFSGYYPDEIKPVALSRTAMEPKYVRITGNIPKEHYIRFETITDDGKNCLVEWVSIVRKEGLMAGRVSQSAMAAYERNDKGELVSIRICDNLGFECEIDRSMIRPENLFVD